MPTERVKRWKVVQEQGEKLYELIQDSLDPNNWDVFVKSENVKVQLSEFLEKAQKRVYYKPEFGQYSPTNVATDSLAILQSLNVLFDNIKHRLEDAFKSILVASQDMDAQIEYMEEDIENLKLELEEQKEMNRRLAQDNIGYTLELKKKELLLEPLKDVIIAGTDDIINNLEEFKKHIGDKEQMERFRMSFEHDIDNLKKLVEIKRERLFNSKIDYAELRVKPEPNKREEKDEAEQAIDDNFVMKRSNAPEILTDSEVQTLIEQFGDEIYMKAKKSVDEEMASEGSPYTNQVYHQKMTEYCIKLMRRKRK